VRPCGRPGSCSVTATPRRAWRLARGALQAWSCEHELSLPRRLTRRTPRLAWAPPRPWKRASLNILLLPGGGVAPLLASSLPALCDCATSACLSRVWIVPGYSQCSASSGKAGNKIHTNICSYAYIPCSSARSSGWDFPVLLLARNAPKIRHRW